MNTLFPLGGIERKVLFPEEREMKGCWGCKETEESKGELKKSVYRRDRSQEYLWNVGLPKQRELDYERKVLFYNREYETRRI